MSAARTRMKTVKCLICLRLGKRSIQFNLLLLSTYALHLRSGAKKISLQYSYSEC